jgi:hypothetical protein
LATADRSGSLRRCKAALGTRTSSNANLAGGRHQELAAFEIVSMFHKYGIKLFDLALESCSREPEKNDAGMGESLLKDKLTKIAVGNY